MDNPDDAAFRFYQQNAGRHIVLKVQHIMPSMDDRKRLTALVKAAG